jgi:hypothetical protein
VKWQEGACCKTACLISGGEREDWRKSFPLCSGTIG